MEQDRFQELVLSELSDIKDRIAGIENRLTAVETKLSEKSGFCNIVAKPLTFCLAFANRSRLFRRCA